MRSTRRQMQRWKSWIGFHVSCFEHDGPGHVGHPQRVYFRLVDECPSQHRSRLHLAGQAELYLLYESAASRAFVQVLLEKRLELTRLFFSQKCPGQEPYLRRAQNALVLVL